MKKIDSGNDDKLIASLDASQDKNDEKKEVFERQSFEVGIDGIVSGSNSISMGSLQGFVRDADPIADQPVDPSNTEETSAASQQGEPEKQTEIVADRSISANIETASNEDALAEASKVTLSEISPRPDKTGESAPEIIAPVEFSSEPVERSTPLAGNETPPQSQTADEEKVTNTSVNDISIPKLELPDFETKIDVGENVSDGRVAGRFPKTDHEGNILTYQITNADGEPLPHSVLEFVGNELRVREGVGLDFETAPLHEFYVTMTNVDGGSRTESFEITVADLNEGPEDIALSANTIDENASGAVIGTLSTTDPDAGDSHSYAVDDARFEVVDGDLKLKDGVSLDYESETKVQVQVTSTDTGGQSLTQAFTIDVNDAHAAQLDLNAVALDAPDNVGFAQMSFGSVTVENSGQTEATHGEGAGETATWTNVGTFHGMSFDVVATVMESNTSGYNNSFFGTSGDNAYFFTSAGQSTVRYEYFESGTGKEIVINSSFVIDDLDGESAREGFSINLDEVDAYGLEANGDILLDNSTENELTFEGEGWSSGGDSTNAVAFSMAGTEGFTITYTADTDGRAFMLEGDWDNSYFSDVQVVDTNLDHADVFTEGGSGTAVSSSEVSITDTGGTTLEGAKIVLSNAQAGDELVATGMPAGIVASVDISQAGQVIVTLTGTASHQDYETALKSVTFQNDNDNLASVTRDIRISVDNGREESEISSMSVHVNELGGQGIAMDTGSNQTDDVLTGNDYANTLTGLGGNDTLIGEDGNDTLDGGAGDDQLSGGAGDDVFLINTMDGNDTVAGGQGASWTDVIEIGGVGTGITINGSSIEGDGWTVLLDDGYEIETVNSGELDLSQDASGVLILDEGGTTEFSGIEKFTW